MSRLIISARFWNNIDWIRASLEHIDCWQADTVYISEGNWDKKFDARSTDGTREIIEDFVASRSNFHVFDNPRFHDNYRYNQALTSNMVMEKADVYTGDWMLIIDADHFYHKKDIDLIKSYIKAYGDQFDYFVVDTICFFKDIKHFARYHDDLGTKLPYKIVDEASWIATNHLAIGNHMYKDIVTLRPNKTHISGLHYECILNARRFKDKYSIGDRRTPEACGRMDNLIPYEGCHPELVIPVLRDRFKLL